ncbi:hypothetical protein [Nocardia terpenica]|uniref:hypothetical protein n=1 Tax=Nocardia terpenica TaxID=455432 RepID=UPI0002EF94D0|nr:hypothetical protein [Nocardia terpenica]NQE89052.1 hypothetical protein [Nocardia terpenica]
MTSHDADLIMQALGFNSAAHAEQVIAEGESRRRERKREQERISSHVARRTALAGAA